MLRWHLLSNEKPKVQNDFAILFKPGILIAGNRGDTFTFGIKGEVGLPFTIDVHERVTVVTGGFLPIGGYINGDPQSNFGEVPILIRMGVEIMANENVAPWFFFDLGPRHPLSAAAALGTSASPGASAQAPPSGASSARTRTSRTPRRLLPASPQLKSPPKNTPSNLPLESSSIQRDRLAKAGGPFFVNSLQLASRATRAPRWLNEALGPRSV